MLTDEILQGYLRRCSCTSDDTLEILVDIVKELRAMGVTSRDLAIIQTTAMGGYRISQVFTQVGISLSMPLDEQPPPPQSTKDNVSPIKKG